MMAAETGRRASKCVGTIVRPQPYSDKSVMETVKDFFSDVVPQAYTSYSGTQKAEDKERILWVQFQQADINDLACNPDLDPLSLPLVLVIGYSNGVQLWTITISGDAQELFSHRQGAVSCLRLLPTPESQSNKHDTARLKRPLIALSDVSCAASGGCTVRVLSLRSGDEVHVLPFKYLPVTGIECNKRVFVVTFVERVAVFESTDFKQLFWITSCYPSTGIKLNPISLGTRWLAYADKKLLSTQQSYGGMSGDGSQSYAATVISAAKSLTKGLSMFGETVVNSVTGTKPSSPKKTDHIPVADQSYQPGIVTIIDTQNMPADYALLMDDSMEGIIAHFHAHANEPIAAMAFDPSGLLLVTACTLGHNFHVFHLMAHPLKSSLGAVHHLYTLHRGDTTAKVIDISFTQDSRWVAISTHRGTTHVFPISTYGGAASVRTHCQPHVVNRASRFHKSAGLEDIDYTGRSSPVLSSSPGSAAHHDPYPSLVRHNAIHNNMGNPRLPPYPHSTLIHPLAQIKQPFLGNARASLPGTTTTGGASTSPGGSFCVAACFATPRSRVGSSPNLCNDARRSVDALFVINQSGLLIEYTLEPRAKATASTDKVTDHSALELGVTGKAQWHLLRSKTSTEIALPLPTTSPLLLASHAVLTQLPTTNTDNPGYTSIARNDSKDSLSSDHSSREDLRDEQWLSQVEIITHLGPHRRLWMGPQFSFKTYQPSTSTPTALHTHSSSLLTLVDMPPSSMDIVTEETLHDFSSDAYFSKKPHRSNPVAMPGTRPAYRRMSGDQHSPSPNTALNTSPLLIEACSFEQSPNICDTYGCWTDNQRRGLLNSGEEEEDRLRETLAEAMIESPLQEGGPTHAHHDCVEALSVSSGSGSI